jgi:hypothetical protein
MSFTASKTTKGFELVGNKLGIPDNGVKYEMTPSLAVKEGDMLIMTNSKAALAVAGSADILGVAAETKTAHATDYNEILVYDNPFNIYECSCSDMQDKTCTGGSTTTLVAQMAVHDTNDDHNGGFLHIYEGTNKGHSRTVSDYTHADDTLTVVDPFPAACDTTTKFIFFGEGEEAGASTINVGTVGVNLKDENTIDADAAVDAVDGPLVCLGFDAGNAIMRVMIIKHRYNSR